MGMVKSKEQKECTHSGSKKKILISGSFYNSYGGVDETEHVYICHDCGAIFLRRYKYSNKDEKEIIDIIMPGETKRGITFHKAAAAMIKLVQDATGEEELNIINKQAAAIRNYVLDRLELLEHQQQ